MVNAWYIVLNVLPTPNKFLRVRHWFDMSGGEFGYLGVHGFNKQQFRYEHNYCSKMSLKVYKRVGELP